MGTLPVQAFSCEYLELVVRDTSGTGLPLLSILALTKKATSVVCTLVYHLVATQCLEVQSTS
jgi:hypothetical protein